MTLSNLKKNKKGFTIIELVIVIAVIAILAAILIPTFSSVINSSKESAAMQRAKTAYTELISSNTGKTASDFASYKIYVQADDATKAYVFTVKTTGQFDEKPAAALVTWSSITQSLPTGITAPTGYTDVRFVKA